MALRKNEDLRLVLAFDFLRATKHPEERAHGMEWQFCSSTTPLRGFREDR